MSSLPPGSFVEGSNSVSVPNGDASSIPTTQPEPTPTSAETAKEAEEEREEAKSLNEAALSIPDSEANDDAASVYEAAIEAVPGDAGVVANAGPSVDWNGVIGHSASGLGAANAATSAYFSFARTATAFGLNVAKRVTQGLVAVPALLADGALTGSAPGDTSVPSISRVTHSGIASLFDAISLVAVGGIDLTSAVTSASLGAAGSGVEGVRRALGSEVLRSLLEFNKLVKREWNAENDSLPPGGLPAYSIIGITKALSTWVSIQIVTRSYQEKPILQGLHEIDTAKLKQEVEALRQTHHVDAPFATLVATTAGEQGGTSDAGSTIASSAAEVRLTSNQAITGEYSGNVIGAEIGHASDASAHLPGSTPSDSPARPLSDAEAVHNLQRYSKLVLGVYGGMALVWLNSMPADSAASSQAGDANPSPAVIFNAEEEFMRQDQAEFLEAAAQMEIEDEDETLETTRKIEAESKKKPNANGRMQPSSYNLWDVISGTHDEALFHRTANLEHGAAAEGSYADDHARKVYNPNDKARPSKPRFYVVTDHPRKTIILVLRGTLSVGDLAADLTCESVPFTFDAQVQANIETKTAAEAEDAQDSKGGGILLREETDLCHEGMLITAAEIGARGRSVHRAVAGALAANAGYSIDIAGHSLGAGVASVLAMIWADPTTGLTTTSSGLPPGRRLHTYCFAVPCVTSASLGRKLGSIITSYTYSYDLVCRLSLGSIQDIRNACAWLCYQDKMAGHTDRNMNALMKRAFEYQSGRMDGSEMEKVEQELLALRKTLEANMGNTHLFPPGKVLYALTEGYDLQVPGGSAGAGEKRKQRLFRVNEDDKEALSKAFGQMIFSRNMLSCHMPNVYDASLLDLTR